MPGGFGRPAKGCVAVSSERLKAALPGGCLYAATLTSICLGCASGFFFNSSFRMPAV